MNEKVRDIQFLTIALELRIMMQFTRYIVCINKHFSLFLIFGSLSLKLHATFGMPVKLRLKLANSVSASDCKRLCVSLAFNHFIILVVVLYISIVYARHVHVPFLLVLFWGSGYGGMGEPSCG